MTCTQCSASVPEDSKFCGTCGTSLITLDAVPTQGTAYLSMPVGRLFVLSVLTWNIYSIYWFYNNWAAIKKAEQSNIWPIARAIFSVLFCYGVFERVMEDAKRREYPSMRDPYILTVVYMGVALLSTIWSKIESSLGRIDLLIVVVILVGDIWPLLVAQRAANFLTRGAEGQKARKIAWWEIVLVVLGAIWMLLVVVGFLLPA